MLTARSKTPLGNLSIEELADPKIMKSTILYLLYRRMRCVYSKFRYRLRKIGNNVLIDHSCSLSRDVVIGDYSYIGPNSIICPMVNIGRFVMLGPSVVIMGKDHKFDIVGQPMIFSGRESLKGTTIEDDVWIGAGAFIMEGITIGAGAIIGAHSVVTKNVPSGEIYAGNPARKIKDRFRSSKELQAHLEILTRGNYKIYYSERR